MLSAKMEGTFYIQNPDKLLYSVQEAGWFVPGVHDLYRIKKRHYVIKGDTNDWHTERMLRLFPTVWRYDNGEIVQDDRLYDDLLRNSDLMEGVGTDPIN